MDLELVVGAGRGRRAGLEAALRDGIRSGTLAPGTRLPSSRALAADLGVARATVVSVYEQLGAEGFLSSRRGAGTVVAPVVAEIARPRASTSRTAGLDPGLLPGAPDVASFPRRAWGQAIRQVLAHAPDDVLGYGDPLGVAELRRALAAYLGRSRAVVVDPDQLSIFGGMATALSYLGRALRRAGVERIGVEDPSLWTFRAVLADSGLELVPVPVDQEGLRVDVLATTQATAVVVTPSHQYPMGVPMSARRRHELVAWARERDAWVVEDDYDGELRYDRQGVGTLQGLVPDRVVYGGSAGKSLAPGLRMAWLGVPDGLARAVAGTKRSAGQCSSLDQLALAALIERGDLDRHLRARRATYRRRRDSLAELLARIPWLDVQGVAAGLHVTALLADGICEDDVARAGASAGLAIAGLGPHWFDVRHAEGLVLGFGRPTTAVFPGLLERLRGVLAAVR